MPLAVNTVRGGCMFTRDDRNDYGEGVRRSLVIEFGGRVKNEGVGHCDCWVLEHCECMYLNTVSGV